MTIQSKIKGWIRQIKMPHTYVILTFLLLLVSILTYLIPAGEYTRVLDEQSGRMIVLADSFHYIQGNRPGIFDIFLSLQKGYVNAADIIFLIIFAYAYVYMLIDNGTLFHVIHRIIGKIGDKTHLLIPISMLLLGLLGSTMGIYEEVYGLVPVFIGIAIALGYDVVVGGAIVFVGVATGFAAATTNPFSIGIAQNIAQLPLGSGISYRIIVFCVFETVSILYIMHYAKKVKSDPTQSVLYGYDQPTISSPASLNDLNYGPLNIREILCLLLFFITIGVLLYGTSYLKWSINEIAAMFLMSMVFTGIISGYSTTKICQTFIESTKNSISSILIIGFTRGILLTIQEAKISDTIVYHLSSLFHGQSKYTSAVGMLIIQNIINFFITGSSSQATITMPIMIPVADIVGISRQTAVMAYHFGDGFSNMFWPTACALECGLMNVPLNKWYRFISPLFVIMLALQIFFIIVSVLIYT